MSNASQHCRVDKTKQVLAYISDHRMEMNNHARYIRVIQKYMRKVEVSIVIKTTPQKIISAFTDAKMLRAWWSVERTLIDLKPGGVYTLAWNISNSGFGFITTGKIRECEQNSILIVDNMVYLNPERPFFGPMTLAVSATQKGDIAELYLCQDGYQSGPDWDWYYAVVKEAWPNVVQNLKNYLENMDDLNDHKK